MFPLEIFGSKWFALGFGDLNPHGIDSRFMNIVITVTIKNACVYSIKYFMGGGGPLSGIFLVAV